MLVSKATVGRQDELLAGLSKYIPLTAIRDGLTLCLPSSLKGTLSFWNYLQTGGSYMVSTRSPRSAGTTML